MKTIDILNVVKLPGNNLTESLIFQNLFDIQKMSFKNLFESIFSIIIDQTVYINRMNCNHFPKNINKFFPVANHEDKIKATLKYIF